MVYSVGRMLLLTQRLSLQAILFAILSLGGAQNSHVPGGTPGFFRAARG